MLHLGHVNTFDSGENENCYDRTCECAHLSGWICWCQ